MRLLSVICLLAVSCHCSLMKQGVKADATEPTNPPLVSAPATPVADGAAVPAPMPEKVTINIGHIDSETVPSIIALIDKIKKEGTVKELYFKINSTGGEVETGNDLIDAIEQAGIPTVCVADHQASSMALAVLESCDKRYMTKRTFLMAHEIMASGVVGNEHQLEQEVETLRVLNRAMMEHLAARTGMSIEKLLAKTNNKMWFMNWPEALKVHMVDGIWKDVRTMPPVVEPAPAGEDALKALLGL